MYFVRIRAYLFKKIITFAHKDRELYKYAEIVYAITQKNMQNTPIF